MVSDNTPHPDEPTLQFQTKGISRAIDYIKHFVLSATSEPPPRINGATPVFSLGRAAEKLTRLRRVAGGSLQLPELQYALSLHNSFRNQLTELLLWHSKNQSAVQFQEFHLLPPVAFLAALLEIYHAALSEQQTPPSGLAREMDELLANTADAAHHLVLFSWLRSTEPLAIAWQSLAAGYQRTSGHTISNGAPGTETDKRQPAIETLHNVLIKVLLLSLADPFSMQRSDIIAADRLVAEHLKEVAIQNTWSQGAVPFDIATGLPLTEPTPAAGNPGQCVVWISITQIAICVQGLQKPSDPATIPAFQTGTLTLPHMLALRWMSFPFSRHLSRQQCPGLAGRVVFGAAALIQAARPQSEPGRSSYRPTCGSECTLHDHCSKGCRIKLAGTGYHNLHPGTLVSIECPSLHQRTTGVLSWVRVTERSQVEAGIRFLANDVDAAPFKLVTHRWRSGNLVEFGLIAPAAPSHTVGATSVEIILPLYKLPGSSIDLIQAVNSGIDYHIEETLEVGRDYIRLGASEHAKASHNRLEFAPFSI